MPSQSNEKVFKVDDLIPAKESKETILRPEDVSPILTTNPKPDTFLKNAAPVLPNVILPVAGGAIAGAAGAGLGATIGTELKNEFPNAFGPPPKDMSSLLTDVGLQTLGGAGAAFAGKNIGALSPITRSVITELKTSGLPHWADLVPWGVASEVAGYGWHNGVKAGLIAKYGPALYRGVKGGIQDYSSVAEQSPEILAIQRSRFGPEFMAAKQDLKAGTPPDIPPIEPVKTVATISGRVPGNYNKAQAIQQLQQALKEKSSEPIWKNVPEPTAKPIPTVEPTPTIATPSGRIPGSLARGEAIEDAMKRIESGEFSAPKLATRDVKGRFIKKSLPQKDQD